MRTKDRFIPLPRSPKATPRHYRNWLADSAPKTRFLSPPSADEIAALRMLAR